MLPINDRMFVQDGYPLGNGQSRMDEAEVVGASRVLKQETVSFDERFSEQFCPGCGRGEAKQITGVRRPVEYAGRRTEVDHAGVSKGRDDPCLVVERLCPESADISVRFLYACKSVVEQVLFEVVVAVEKDEVFASCMSHPCIAGHAGEAVFLLKNNHVAVRLGILFGQFVRTVGRSIVDDDDLEVFERLRQNRVHALREVFNAVVEWHDNRYFRVGNHSAYYALKHGWREGRP